MVLIVSRKRSSLSSIACSSSLKMIWNVAGKYENEPPWTMGRLRNKEADNKRYELSNENLNRLRFEVHCTYRSPMVVWSNCRQEINENGGDDFGRLVSACSHFRANEKRDEHGGTKHCQVMLQTQQHARPKRRDVSDGVIHAIFQSEFSVRL
mmetsp:Transcript_10006/g.21867  ORF Transcript_10006/g.21867 Transcript_10006/m.21867 type:complete len:152 (-) Transcript_10006:372-827(-)